VVVWGSGSDSDARDYGDGQQRAPGDEADEAHVGGWRRRMEGPVRVMR